MLLLFVYNVDKVNILYTLVYPIILLTHLQVA